MSGKQANGGKGGGFRRLLRVPARVAAVVLPSLLLAPTVVNAFSNGTESLPVSLAARGGVGSFTPASVDPRLVAQVSAHALVNGKLFRFTPAGTENRPDRAVTVAVRLPELRARLIGARSAPAAGNPGLAAVRIAPTVYNLGLARGYQSFASVTASLPRESTPDNAELRTFSLAPSQSAAANGFSRIEPRIAVDEKDKTGRAPRTPDGQGDYQVDLGGSYRLTGNLDVTAGIRYSSDRDRLRALTDHRQDSQAIYVGTKFRF